MNEEKTADNTKQRRGRHEVHWLRRTGCWRGDVKGLNVPSNIDPRSVK